jgi:hypothetical protein
MDAMAGVEVILTPHRGCPCMAAGRDRNRGGLQQADDHTEQAICSARGNVKALS